MLADLDRLPSVLASVILQNRNAGPSHYIKFKALHRWYALMALTAACAGARR